MGFQSGQVRGAFNLVQPFPRHVYTAEEMDKSFVDLYLTPSCTLTVEQVTYIHLRFIRLFFQKRSKSSSQMTPSNLLSYIPFLFSYLVLSPLSCIFGIIRKFFGTDNTAAKKKEESSKKTKRVNGGGDTTVRRVSYFSH